MTACSASAKTAEAGFSCANFANMNRVALLLDAMIMASIIIIALICRVSVIVLISLLAVVLLNTVLVTRKSKFAMEA
jgi:hypothetical protein